MAQNDFTEAGLGLPSPSVLKSVSGAFTPPNGGGTFVYGMRSTVNTEGAVALYVDASNFTPIVGGGQVTAALQKGGGGGNTNHAPFIFLSLQGTDVTGSAYMLGLSEGDPASIVLRKGALVDGLTDDPVGTNGVLARSSATFSPGTWIHLLLQQVVNTSGDVVLNVSQNDLSVNAVTSPTWVAISGMSGATGGQANTAFIDDALAANSGSAPFTGGRAGFGGQFSDVSRLVLFDHFTLARQV